MARGCCSRSRYNIIMMSIAFMVLFCAYNTLQNYATSLFPPGLGNQSLAVLYGVCGISVFTAPALVEAVGPRMTMIVGAVCYVVYMAGLWGTVPAAVLSLSAVIGWGAAVLWIAFGVFVTQNSSPDSYAQNTGLFWSIFQLNLVAGNLIVWGIFPSVTSDNDLYAGFAVTGAVGTALLFFLRAPKSPEEEAAEEEGTAAGGAHSKLLGDESQLAVAVRGMTERRGSSGSGSGSGAGGRVSCGQRLASVWRGAVDAAKLLLTVDMWLLIPLFTFSGIELSFWTGEYPQLLAPSVIGLVLCFAGIGEVVGGWVLGRVSDVAGRSISLLIGTALYTGALALTCWMKDRGMLVDPILEGAPLLTYVAAFMYGTADACFNANAYAMCSQLYGSNLAPAGSGNGHEEERLLGQGGHGAGADLSRHSRTSTFDYTVRDGQMRFGELMSDAADEEHGSVNRAAGAAGGGTGGGGEGAPVWDAAKAGVASVGAFTIFQLVQNLGSAAWYWLALQIPLHDPPGQQGTFTQAYIQAGLLALSLLTFVIVDRKHAAKAHKAAAL